MTYWVEYTYSYDYWDKEEQRWCNDGEYADSGRFHCPKRNIHKEVESRIKEELDGEQYKNLKFEIYDMYPTTDAEL